MNFLVTAGSTREMIDQVRDWGNIFTGNTGFDIAKALAPHGQVDLLTSNRKHLAMLKSGRAGAPSIHAVPFASHADLLAALESCMARQHYDAIFMTAAVADYRPALSANSNERNSPGSAAALVSRQFIFQRTDQDVRVKIQHSRTNLWT